MRLRFIWPGKTKDEHLRALVEEYLKRLTRFVRCEVIETREGTSADPASVKKESERILDAIPPASVALLLDVNGLEWDSPELANAVRRWEHDAIKEVAIVIGGPDGAREEGSARAQRRCGLTSLTPAHEMDDT